MSLPAPLWRAVALATALAVAGSAAAAVAHTHLHVSVTDRAAVEDVVQRGFPSESHASHEATPCWMCGAGARHQIASTPQSVPETPNECVPARAPSGPGSVSKRWREASPPSRAPPSA